MGFFDKFIQHQEDAMPRGKHIEEAEMQDDGSISYTIKQGRKTITYTVSPQEAQQSFQAWERKGNDGKLLS